MKYRWNTVIFGVPPGNRSVENRNELNLLSIYHNSSEFHNDKAIILYYIILYYIILYYIKLLFDEGKVLENAQCGPYLTPLYVFTASKGSYIILYSQALWYMEK